MRIKQLLLLFPWRVIRRSHFRSAVAALGILFTVLESASGQTWTLTSAPTNRWWGVASSADGIKMVAVVNGGLIYTSTNSGDTWVPNNAPSTNWYSVASSADGNKLVAVANNGPVYSSTNSGDTWVSNTIPIDGMPVKSWYWVASSADGNKLAAVVNGGPIYMSTNSGATWAASSAPAKTWNSIACSADGTKLTVVAGYPGLSSPIYSSTNSGANWRSNSAPARNWASVTCSADGDKLLAAAYMDDIFASPNSGSNWAVSFHRPISTGWVGAASDASGRMLVAVTCCGGPIYSSTNSGSTWSSNSAPGRNWEAVASSADGAKRVAVVFGGGIYTSQLTPNPSLNIEAVGNEAVISWIIPSRDFVLQEISDLSDTNWIEVLTAITTTNYECRATVALTSGKKFYRLRTP